MGGVIDAARDGGGPLAGVAGLVRGVCMPLTGEAFAEPSGSRLAAKGPSSERSCIRTGMLK